MINTEYQRIRSSIVNLDSLKQVQPTLNWIELFEKAYNDKDDSFDLRYLLTLKKSQLNLGYNF